MYLGILWHKWALSKLKFSAKSHNLDGNLASVKKKKDGMEARMKPKDVT